MDEPMDPHYSNLKSAQEHIDQAAAEIALAKLVDPSTPAVTIEAARLGRCRIVVSRDSSGRFVVWDLDPARLYVFATVVLQAGTVEFVGMLEGTDFDVGEQWEVDSYRVSVEYMKDIDERRIKSAVKCLR
ncbi:MAG: hypothetical protein KJO98_15410 [Rhodothermia bacterium]|nr:hypothetical protein [Rhodothermia bacterium]